MWDKLAVNEVFCKFIDSDFGRSIADSGSTSISIINVCFSKNKSLPSGSWLVLLVNGAIWGKSVLIFAFWQVGHSVQAVAQSLNECTVFIPAVMAVMIISTLVTERYAWRKRLTDIHTLSHTVPLMAECHLCCGSP